MLEWLIIGGGVHGTYLSHVLTAQGRVPPGRVRVLDPYQLPLTAWKIRAHNTGMTFLRSPDVHNLDLDPMSLWRFTSSLTGRPYACFGGTYRNQPGLELFHAHATWTIQLHRLKELRLSGTARAIRRRAGGLEVETTAGNLRTRRVLLAPGPAAPLWPDWARALRARGAPIQHLFDLDWQRDALPFWQHLVVIGGGISAVQVALALSRRAPGRVTFLPRHPLREHPFDADPCWFSGCLSTFLQERDMQQRRAILQRARYRGSVPAEIVRTLEEALAWGQLTHHTATVTAATWSPASDMTLTLDTSPGTLQADRLLLATGFKTVRPGGTWLTHVIADLHLPCSPCGYPCLDATLCWQDGIYVSGALAELEIGPVARNIMGARLAGRRLLQAL